METTQPASASLPKSTPPSAHVQTYDIIFHIVSMQLITLVGVVANIFILIVFRKNKNLQTPCFILISGECICALLVAGGFYMDSIQEIGLLAGSINPNRTRLACFLSSSLVPSSGIQSSSMVTASIALDRLFSILRPVQYRNAGHRYAYLILALCFSYGVSASIGGVFSNPSEMTAILECTNYFSSFTRPYMAYYSGFNLTFSGLCVVLYTCMLITFQWRKKRIDMNNQADRSFMKQQLACMPTVKLMMAVYTLTAIGPEILVAIASTSDYTAAFLPRMYYFASFIKAAVSWAEMVALGLGSQQFRQGARAVLGMGGEVQTNTRKSGRVRPIAVNPVNPVEQG